MQEFSQLEIAEEFTKLTNSWEERGIRKGIEQGIEQGKKEVVIEMIKEGASIDFKVTHLDKKTIENLRKMH